MPEIEIDLNAEAVHNLQNALTEAVRASEEGVQRFIEPASGTLSAALSRRPHLIFGRRGSGKTSLLRKAIAEHNLDRRPSAFVDMEPFKGHTYPDVLISILIEFFRSLRLWLNEGAVAPANRAKIWKRWFSKPRKGPLRRATAQEISAEVDSILTDLEELLHSQDDAEIEHRLQVAAKQASDSKVSVSVSGQPTAPIAAGLSKGASSSHERNEDILEKLRRSKGNYLHRRILEYQRLLKRVVDLADADGLLILDDLYYIRRSDQPFVVDYFHRLTKNQRLWLKVGTIRHRSSWYVRGDPAIGTKLGDDADEINLDITLEKYSTAKAFLVRVFGDIAAEVSVEPNHLLTNGAVDREREKPWEATRRWSRGVVCG
ncbi:MAG: KAP family NTPase [Actinobacteria bacterium]|nr:KAP family NTPase [Actinomycetota bacterium]